MSTVQWMVVCTLLLFHQGSANFLEPNCGSVNSYDQSISDPWMAEIRNGPKFICSGTLISKRLYFIKNIYLGSFQKCFYFLGYVLTAASCIINLIKPIIRLGISKDRNSYTDFNSTEGYIHYSYSEDGNENNVGMIRLEKEVEYTSYIRPICITINPASQSNKNNIGSQMKASSLDNHNSRFTFEEKMIEKPEIGFLCKFSSSCVEDKYAVKLISKPIGRPWTKAIPDGALQRYVQHGILSYRVRSKMAYVYTDISAYSDWIVLLALDVEINIQDNNQVYH
ncbi:hypothetical protein KR084_012354 [Drosophila pseudotakahashii]|nr:hypothetical protein KR084_012354 [Drosophila pseudotakahashii]